MTPSIRSSPSSFCAAVTERHPPDPEHPGAALPQPVPGGQVGRHPRRAVRRPLHTVRRHRLPARRVQRAGRRLRSAQCALRRRHRGDPRHLEQGRLRPRGVDVHRQGPVREPQAGSLPSDLDRREQPVVPAPRCPLRQRLEPLPRSPRPGPDGEDTAARDPGRPAPDARRAVAVRRRGRAGPVRRSTCRSAPVPGEIREATAFNADAQLAAVEELAQLGITWAGVGRAGRFARPRRRVAPALRRVGDRAR